MNDLSDHRPVPGPVFSVIVPSFNAAQFYTEALDSALSQLGPDDELLLQDAGSTDGTQDIIARYATADSRVRAQVCPDTGQSDALNKALARARPSWIIWLNADDVILPGALEAIRQAIVDHPEGDVFYGDMQIIRSDGSIVEVFAGRALLTKELLRRGITAFSGSIAIRDSELRALGGLQEHLHAVMDLELQLRISRTSLTQIKVDAPVGALRFHDATKTSSIWRTFVGESHAVRMQYSQTPVEKVLCAGRTLGHAAQLPLLKLRLNPAYRALRRRTKPAHLG